MEEIELTLAVAPERATDVSRLEFLRHFTERRSTTRQLSTVYFDTPDQILAKRGIALRVRRAGRRQIQSIELPAEGPGEFRIGREFETPITGGRPDLDMLTEPRLRRLFADARVVDALAPAFAMEFRRTRWPLRYGGSLIDFAFDRGEIQAGEARLPLCEIVLELKQGRPEHVFELALAVHRVLPVWLRGETKAARGYGLLAGTGAHPVKASPTGLIATMSARDAFGVAVRNCLAQMRGNEAAACLGRDPEGIHQLRVGLRRLRALVSAYRDALAPKAHEFLSRELRWLQQELNPARDWDVFIATTLEPISGHAPDLQPGFEAANELRGVAQERARTTLLTARYTDFMLRCYLGLVTGDWASGEAGSMLDRPIGDFAGAILQRRHRRLRKFGGKRAELPEPDLHRLRLMAKKQRYVGEFFRELYPRKATGKYIAALAAIQEVLGSLNDALVSRHLVEDLERFLADVPSVGTIAAARGAGVILGWQAARISSDLRRLVPVWKDFIERKIFWPEPED
jgi:inorganic triphosphatase YgiF